MKQGYPTLLRTPLLWLSISMLLIAGLTLISPAEKTLGVNARIVYLHGAWVWASLFALVAAGAAGVFGLVSQKDQVLGWSRSLGRTGMVFWISYLPISMWAMETNWNGLFLAEPRWRFAVIFAVSGLLLQIGLSLVDHLPLDAVGNILFIAALFAVLRNTEKVMHPPGPMVESNLSSIQVYFAGLTLVAVFAAWQVARWFNIHARPQRINKP